MLGSRNPPELLACLLGGDASLFSEVSQGASIFSSNTPFERSNIWIGTTFCMFLISSLPLSLLSYATARA
jgi:hypothetical protein